MSNLDPNSVPVPVHFDGHNINIITQDSPSMCKDRIRNLTLYKTHIKKKRKNGFRNKHNNNNKLAGKTQMVNRGGPSGAQSAETSPGSKGSSFPDEDSKSNSPSRTPGVAGGGFKPSESSRPSYSSKLMKDTPEPPAPPSHDGEHIPSGPSPSKKGLNTNATPFVMSPSISRAGPESNDVRNGMNAVGRHREDYMVPPRHREYGDVHRQKPAQPQRVTDEMLIAQGYDPNDFGSYDDPDEDDQKLNYKGKDRRCLFKTELCREWSTSGWCYYNRRCSFAHGLHELRPVFRSKKWRTKRCRNWHTTGYCPYEHRCQFLHDQNPPRRMNDYSAQAKGQPTPTEQEKMKPLYFHYQVEEAANDENQEPSNSNRDETPSKSHSQGVDKENGMEQPPRKRNKDTVITQFNPATQPMFDPSGMQNGMQSQNIPYANLGAAPPAVAAPFPMYPPTGLPMANGMQTTMPNGIPNGMPMMNAPLMNPLMGQMALGIPGMAASPAPANCNPMNQQLNPLLTAGMAANPQLGGQLMTTNPPSNVDSTVYLHFTPSPPQVGYEEMPRQQMHGQHGQQHGQHGQHANMNMSNMSNMGSMNMMSLAMSAVQTDGPSMEMPASLTPPPASMYEATAMSVNRHNMSGLQPQQMQQHQHQQQMYMQQNVEREESPTPSCILMDENILLDLLPADGAGADGRDQTAEAPESVHSNTRKSKTATVHDAHDDDAKEAEDLNHFAVSTAGLAPPCPPALQLQTSDESVVMGAVDAAFLNGGVSPATGGIHVPALQAHSLISQQAHIYAQAQVNSQVNSQVHNTVHNSFLLGTPMTPMTPLPMTPLNMTPSFEATRSAFSWNIPLMQTTVHPAQTVTAVAPVKPTQQQQTVERE